MATAPRLDTVTPISARPGDTLTLAGAFGAQTDASSVRLRIPAEGSAPVPATIVDWSDATIHAELPPLASFGSGGPLEVTVHTDGGDSAVLTIVLLEEAPPALAAVAPARGLEGDTVTLTGDRFGRATSTSAVVFVAPGPADVAAEVVSWTPTALTVKVPSLLSLGGAGDRTVAVVTPWGRSDPAAFLLGELPEVTEVVPYEPSPGATITVRGRAFGPQASGKLELVAFYATPDPTAPRHATVPAVISWTDTEIKAVLPSYQALRTTGARDAVVTSEWGPNRVDARSRVLIESRASITCWTRIEPHARTSDVQEGLGLGLEAQVYDPLWLLGRQWQLLELKGDDGGSPVSVRVDGTCTPLSRWQPHGGEPQDVPADVPLEAAVERERVTPRPDGSSPPADLRLAAEAGLQLLRMIDAQLRNQARSDDYRRRFLTDYPLELPADADALDAASARFLGVAAGRVPDGLRIHADFQVALAPTPQLPAKPPIDGNDRSAILAAIRAWYAWFDDLFSEPATPQHAWNRERIEYAFSAGAGDLVLDAREHDGGHLDWYSFVRRAPGATLGAATSGRGPAAFTRSAIPSAVSYPGMPVPRWWELEDRRVDFGSVAAAPNELLKLVLVEFATVYGNDWFTLPLDALPVGTLCELASVEVVDAFGASTALAPFGDGAGTDWRMFELARDDGAADAGNALLLLDALPATQESSAIEEVLMLRDELANMAWAVEKKIESRTGRPLDRHEDEVARRPQPTPEASGMRRYVLQTPVPRNWIPLLPKLERDAGGAVVLRRLARGAIRDPQGGTPIPPRGRLLEPGVALDLFDEEVPRAGARVSRLWTLGRAPSGKTHLWRGRRKSAGRGEGSSGLRFDDISGRR
jgi:hypothetical protein